MHTVILLSLVMSGILHYSISMNMVSYSTDHTHLHPSQLSREQFSISTDTLSLPRDHITKYSSGLQSHNSIQKGTRSQLSTVDLLGSNPCYQTSPKMLFQSTPNILKISYSYVSCIQITTTYLVSQFAYVMQCRIDAKGRTHNHIYIYMEQNVQ